VGSAGEKKLLNWIERRGEFVLWCSLYIWKLLFDDKTVVLASGSRLNTGLMLSV